MNLRFTTLLSLLLLNVLFSNAQMYQPVHGGDFFSLQDINGKIYHLEVTEVVPIGTDTIFRFNRVCRDLIWNSPTECDFTPTFSHYACDRENIWGDYMLKEPGGEYYFVTKDSQTFYLPVNNLTGTFTFYSGPSGTVTGSYTNTLYNVSPAFPNDSVRVFSLSNGQQIHVSSDHGLFESFDFMSLDTLSNVTNHFTLADLSLPVGQADFKKLTELYDYQVGDVKVTYDESWDFGGSFIWKRNWVEDSVLSFQRSFGPLSDTVKITYRRRTLTDEIPNYPFSNNDTTFWTPWSTVNVTITDLGVISNEYSDDNFALMTGAEFNSTWGGNYSQSYITSFWKDSCYQNLNETWDYYAGASYTGPYGQTSSFVTSFSSWSSELLCFTRGSQTWGTCPNWGTILNREEPELASLEVFPNPGRDRVVIRARGVAELSVEVLDLQGKRVGPVWKGEREVDLDLGELVAGVYLLKISSAGKSSFRKWVKASGE